MSLRRKNAIRAFVFSNAFLFWRRCLTTKNVQECAVFYKELLHKTYYITLEGGTKFYFSFKPEYFFHLLGLEKLKDIDQFRKLSKKNIYKKILNGEIKSSLILSSKHYPKISGRIHNFEIIKTLLNKEKTKIIIDFDPSKVPGTKLERTKFMFYSREKCGYCHLAIGYNNNYYPETFFFEYSKRYISEQTLLDIIDIEIV